MKIIKAGKPESTKEYTATCQSCYCEFSFKQAEVRWQTHPTRPGEDCTPYSKVACPQRGCNAVVTVYK